MLLFIGNTTQKFLRNMICFISVILLPYYEYHHQKIEVELSCQAGVQALKFTYLIIIFKMESHK